MRELHPLYRWVKVFAAAALAACSDSDEPSAPPLRELYLAVAPQAKSVVQGDSATIEVHLSSNGAFSGLPQLTISSAPDGVTARIQISQSSVRIASALVMISVGANVEPGRFVLWFTMSDPGAEPVSKPLTLHVLFKETSCALTELCSQWGKTATASSQYTEDDWAAYQATGVPNVNGCNDDPKAWASAEPDDGEWLEVEFAQSVFPTLIEIYESLTVSAIVKVELKDESSVYHTVHTATPKVYECPRVLSIPVTSVNIRIKSVRIHFNQVALGYWSEIDAVRLAGYRER